MGSRHLPAYGRSRVTTPKANDTLSGRERRPKLRSYKMCAASQCSFARLREPLDSSAYCCEYPLQSIPFRRDPSPTSSLEES